ncbi:MAG: amidohydrolase family protein [Planctomycetes bacterium]|nr:amidohydrolase family protein [Planctomycetota bacterium]
MRGRSKFSILLISALFAIIINSCAAVVRPFAGTTAREPSKARIALSTEARALIDAAYVGLDESRLLDYHAHLVGLGEGESGCYVNANLRSWLHPVERVRFLIYKIAAGIEDAEQAESQYVERLVARAREQPGRMVLLAMDQYYDKNGRADRGKTQFYVPNAYVRKIADEHPDLFIAACSIHPYRADAIRELEECASAGARIVKWLPSAMGIDPADPRCVPFYDRMRELNMILLAHAGDEHAVNVKADPRFGNPQLLRTALERGVKVIIAHCASSGESADVDDRKHPTIENWRLFIKMMDDPRWCGLLVGDISAIAQGNRAPESLLTLLRREDLHSRLVNGTDYPIPAINIVVRTGKLRSLGLITPDERRALNEIYKYDPVVFDFVLKRTLHLTDPDGTVHRFAPSVFVENAALRIGDGSNFPIK